MPIIEIEVDVAPGPNCKFGCLGNRKGWVHRSPIECTTLADLYASLDDKEIELGRVRERNTRLKAALYDYERQED